MSDKPYWDDYDGDIPYYWDDPTSGPNRDGEPPPTVKKITILPPQPSKLQSNVVFRSVDLICEGEIEGLVDGDKSIYLDGVPLRTPITGSYNFENVVTDESVGDSNGKVLKDFNQVENTKTKGLPIELSYRPDKPTYVVKTISDSNVDAVRLNFRLANLFWIDDDGSYKGYECDLRVDIQASGEPWVQVIKKGGALYFKGIARSSYERSVTIDNLSSYGSAPYNIRAYRMSADSDKNPKRNNKSYWTSYTEIINVKLTYPHSACYAIQCDARSMSGNLPKRVYHIRGRKIEVPSNYTFYVKARKYLSASSFMVEGDYRTILSTGATFSCNCGDDGYMQCEVLSSSYSGNLTTVVLTSGSDNITSNLVSAERIYTGSWDGTFQTSWCANNAWVYYDILKDPRACGGIDAIYIDKWTLYSIAQYNDVLVDDGYGKKEPRFSFNGIIKTIYDAQDLFRIVAATFNAMAFWGSGYATLSQDSPRSATRTYTNANVIDGEFVYDGAGLKDIHTAAIVVWNDPANLGDAVPEYVQNDYGIERYGYKEKRITALGCNSRGLAHRIGKWVLDTEIANPDNVKFRASFDVLDAVPGEVIEIADQFYGDKRFGFRVISDSTTPVSTSSSSDSSRSISSRSHSSSSGSSESGSSQSVLSESESSSSGSSSSGSSQSGGGGGGLDFDDGGLDFDDGGLDFGGANESSGSKSSGSKSSLSTSSVSRSSMSKSSGSKSSFSSQSISVSPSSSSDSSSSQSIDPLGGEVIQVEGTFVKEVGESYSLHAVIRDGDGDPVVETVTIFSATATANGTNIGVSSGFSRPLEANEIVIVSQVDDSINLRQFKLISIEELEKNIYGVFGIEYDEDKFARVEQDIKFVEETKPPITLDVSPPTNLELSEFTYASGENNFFGLDVAWTAPKDPRVTSYTVQYEKTTSQPGTDPIVYETVGIVKDPFFQIKPIDATGEGRIGYSVRVRSETLLGHSVWVEEEISILSSAPNPIDVTGLQVKGGGVNFTTGDCHIEWDDMTGIINPRFKSYRVRVRKPSGKILRTINRVTPDFSYTFAMNAADHGGLPQGTLVFQVQCEDIYGNFSLNVAQITAVNNPPLAPSGLTGIPFMYGAQFTWNQNVEPDFKHYQYRFKISEGVGSEFSQSESSFSSESVNSNSESSSSSSDSWSSSSSLSGSKSSESSPSSLSSFSSWSSAPSNSSESESSESSPSSPSSESEESFSESSSSSSESSGSESSMSDTSDVQEGVWESSWTKAAVSMAQRLLTSTEKDNYRGNAYISIQVRAVDVFNQTSSISEHIVMADGLNVKATDIDDFAITASKIFIERPVVSGLVVTNDSPSAGYISWNQHYIYYNGVEYTIAAGNTNNYYVYWKDLASTYGTTAEGTHPQTLTNWTEKEDHIIIINISGSHQVAWSSVANQMIGSAYIMNASIVDAHINEITAAKMNVTQLSAITANLGTITAGTLSSSNYTTTTGVRIDLANRFIKMGGSNTVAGGTQKGVFMGWDSTHYKIYAGNGSTEYFKFDGTKVVISSASTDAIVIESGGNIRVNSGGDIKLYGGGDLVLYGDPSDPAEIQWNDSTNNLVARMGVAEDDIIELIPSQTNAQRLYIGTVYYTSPGITRYWERLFTYVSQWQKFRTYDTVDECYLSMTSTDVELFADDTITLQADTEIILNANDVRPFADNSVDLGTSSYGFRQMFLSLRTTAPSGYTDGTVVFADSSWHGVGTKDKLAFYNGTEWRAVDSTVFV